MRDKILLIDDEPNLRMILSTMLEREGYLVFAFEGFNEAREALNSEDFDLVITDLAMPLVSGLEVLQYCQAYSPDLPVILITAFGTIESAVTALKSGAFDFVLKPFDQDELFRTVQKAIQSRKRRKREPALDLMSAKGVGPVAFPLFGDEPETQKLRDSVHLASKGSQPVLILGEVGTGKRSIAYEIHRKSDRSRGPFVQIQAEAVPSVFQRSELLGVEKGAMPTALFSKPGAFELAQGGTLFIEEITALGVDSQNALFSSLEDEVYYRMGGAKRLPFDLRLIVTSSKDWGEITRSGSFHSELDFKLSSDPIFLKPLRERKQDLVYHLAPYFIQRSANRRGVPNLPLSPEAIEFLQQQPWPGNLGELERDLDRAVANAIAAQVPVMGVQQLIQS
jgi:DNA-binding NtrC family response regulator